MYWDEAEERALSVFVCNFSRGFVSHTLPNMLCQSQHMSVLLKGNGF